MRRSVRWHTGAVSDLPPLAEFLRSRRERLTPERAGLQPTGRRRTPGLRREELATRAGVSIDYLIRLEQGRDTNPSAEIIAALANALQLDADETRHLYGLAARSASPHLEQFCPAAPVLDAPVSATVEVLLAQLDPIPAFVLGPLGDVLAANDAWSALMATRRMGVRHNMARYLFGDPAARDAFPRWELAADAEVVRLRVAHRQLEQAPQFVALIDELRTLPEFAARWDAHPVSHESVSTVRLSVPDAPELHLHVEVLDLHDRDQQLVTWLPGDASAESTIGSLLGDQLPVSPAHLRVVGDD